MLALGILFVLFGLVSLGFFGGGGAWPNPIPPIEKIHPFPFFGCWIASIIDAVVTYGVEEICAIKVKAIPKVMAIHAINRNRWQKLRHEIGQSRRVCVMGETKSFQSYGGCDHIGHRLRL